MIGRRVPLGLLAASFALAAGAEAGEAAVVEAKAQRERGGDWSFTVTVAHADEGWGHYADAFTVELPGGTELGRRVLAHPHVNEQPFTRSLRGVRVPEGTAFVLVRAHDSVHGAGEPVRVPLID